MGRIPDETIQAIRDRVDLVELIGRYVALKSAGRNHKGLCPFHEEKTPSFNVNADRQIFHCFGCDAGGNAFTFLMRHENLTFPEAARELGRQVGVEVQESDSRETGLYEQLRELTLEAKSAGLGVVVWSYPRGSGISKDGETAIDVCAYAAQIAAQLGAHFIKVKPPSDHIEQDAARKVYEGEQVPIATLTERVRHVVQSSFDGRRIVIFSGGGKADDEAVFEQVTAIRDGGGFGSIIGRNSFQRSKEDALKFLSRIMDIYK